MDDRDVELLIQILYEMRDQLYQIKDIIEAMAKEREHVRET